MRTFNGQVADKMIENEFMTGQVTTYMNHLCIDKDIKPTLNDYKELQNNVSAFVIDHF